MEFKAIIRPTAYLQIIEAVGFVAKVSIEASQNLYQEIMDAFNSLKEFPYRFPIDERFNIFKKPEHKIVLGKGRYFALYYVEKDMVIIEQFCDNRKK